METVPIRVWKGVHEAVQIYAESKDMDASSLASMLIMQSLMASDELPEEARVALTTSFFEALGTIITEKKSELAKWALAAMKGD